MNVTVTTNQKSKRNIQEIKRKQSKHNTAESPQHTRGEQENREGA